MSKFTLLLISLFLTTQLSAQDKPKSPPATLTATYGNTEITIDYNAPSAKGRTIWGDLVPYNELWRTGANGATKFTTSTAITVEGQSLPAGTYALFTIPTATDCTVIFNSVADQWGSYNYSKDKDVLRVNVKPKGTPAPVETMKFVQYGDVIALEWANLSIPMKIKA